MINWTIYSTLAFLRPVDLNGLVQNYSNKILMVQFLLWLSVGYSSLQMSVLLAVELFPLTVKTIPTHVQTGPLVRLFCLVRLRRLEGIDQYYYEKEDLVSWFPDQWETHIRKI